MLILITLAVKVWLFAYSPGAPILSQLSSNWSLVVSLAAWIAIALYFYRARTARAYYLILSGRRLPEELSGVEFSPPRIVVSLMGKLSLLSEWALILLAFAVFFGLLLFSDRV